jgi:hypothetical protein
VFLERNYLSRGSIPRSGRYESGSQSSVFAKTDNEDSIPQNL